MNVHCLAVAVAALLLPSVAHGQEVASGVTADFSDTELVFNDPNDPNEIIVVGVRSLPMVQEDEFRPHSAVVETYSDQGGWEKTVSLTMHLIGPFDIRSTTELPSTERYRGPREPSGSLVYRF